MTWPKPIQDIIDEFQEIDEQFERLEILMDFAKEVDELPVEDWNEQNLVKGCQSIAHIEVNIRDDLKRTWERTTRLERKSKGLEPPHAPQLTGKYGPK